MLDKNNSFSIFPMTGNIKGTLRKKKEIYSVVKYDDLICDFECFKSKHLKTYLKGENKEFIETTDLDNIDNHNISYNPFNSKIITYSPILKIDSLNTNIEKNYKLKDKTYIKNKETEKIEKFKGCNSNTKNNEINSDKNNKTKKLEISSFNISKDSDDDYFHNKFYIKENKLNNFNSSDNYFSKSFTKKKSKEYIKKYIESTNIPEKTHLSNKKEYSLNNDSFINFSNGFGKIDFSVNKLNHLQNLEIETEDEMDNFSNEIKDNLNSCKFLSHSINRDFNNSYLEVKRIKKNLFLTEQEFMKSKNSIESISEVNNRDIFLNLNELKNDYFDKFVEKIKDENIPQTKQNKELIIKSENFNKNDNFNEDKNINLTENTNFIIDNSIKLNLIKINQDEPNKNIGMSFGNKRNFSGYDFCKYKIFDKNIQDKNFDNIIEMGNDSIIKESIEKENIFSFSKRPLNNSIKNDDIIKIKTEGFTLGNLVDISLNTKNTENTQYLYDPSCNSKSQSTTEKDKIISKSGIIINNNIFTNKTIKEQTENFKKILFSSSLSNLNKKKNSNHNKLNICTKINPKLLIKNNNNFKKFEEDKLIFSKKFNIKNRIEKLSFLIDIKIKNKPNTEIKNNEKLNIDIMKGKIDKSKYKKFPYENIEKNNIEPIKNTINKKETNISIINEDKNFLNNKIENSIFESSILIINEPRKLNKNNSCIGKNPFNLNNDSKNNSEYFKKTEIKKTVKQNAVSKFKKINNNKTIDYDKKFNLLKISSTTKEDQKIDLFIKKNILLRKSNFSSIHNSLDFKKSKTLRSNSKNKYNSKKLLVKKVKSSNFDILKYKINNNFPEENINKDRYQCLYKTTTNITPEKIKIKILKIISKEFITIKIINVRIFFKIEYTIQI